MEIIKMVTRLMLLVTILVYIVTHPGQVIKFLASLVFGTALLGGILFGIFYGLACIVF
jgi:hypothetical protein